MERGRERCGDDAPGFSESDGYVVIGSPWSAASTAGLDVLLKRRGAYGAAQRMQCFEASLPCEFAFPRLAAAGSIFAFSPCSALENVEREAPLQPAKYGARYVRTASRAHESRVFSDGVGDGAARAL